MLPRLEMTASLQIRNDCSPFHATGERARCRQHARRDLRSTRMRQVEADPGHAYMKIDDVRVKGKENPVAIYEPLGPRAGLAESVRRDAADFEAAFARYRAQDWTAAEAALAALNHRAPRTLYDIYLERIAHFRVEPPPADWDGVFVYTTK